MSVKSAPWWPVFAVQGLLPSLCRVACSSCLRPARLDCQNWRRVSAQTYLPRISWPRTTFHIHTLRSSSPGDKALERPRLEWGTETMSTISCSKVKKKKKKVTAISFTWARTDKAVLWNVSKRHILSFLAGYSEERVVYFWLKLPGWSSVVVITTCCHCSIATPAAVFAECNTPFLLILCIKLSSTHTEGLIISNVEVPELLNHLWCLWAIPLNNLGSGLSAFINKAFADDLSSS